MDAHILSSLAGMKTFCKIYVIAAYLQIFNDKHFKEVTKINTLIGLLRWKRRKKKKTIPYGIQTESNGKTLYIPPERAPGIFQEKSIVFMRIILLHIQGIKLRSTCEELGYCRPRNSLDLNQTENLWILLKRRFLRMDGNLETRLSYIRIDPETDIFNGSAPFPSHFEKEDHISQIKQIH